MRRPPRPPRKRLLDAATLLGSLAEGALVFVAVASAYLWGLARALPQEQSAALAFIALVAGNIALIVANRAPASGRWRLAANPVFWLVATFAALLVVFATRVQPVAGWFGFAPPPWLASVLCVAAPMAMLLLADAARRTVFRNERHAV